MRNDKLTIYLAGKMSGLNKEEYNGWRKSITEDLIAYARSCGSNVQVINPADYFDFDDMERHLEKEVMQFDLNMVRQSDVLIVNIDDASDSIGTAIEVYEANRLNVPVIAYTECGIVNDDIHPWIENCLSTVQMNRNELITYIRDFYMERYI
jgi:nucleoside 2-deoxyribosyltransferase|nr:MAG TPA: Nucleoside 2-deoxyribosyltransferase [Caudoviricetes sp.]